MQINHLEYLKQIEKERDFFQTQAGALKKENFLLRLLTDWLAASLKQCIQPSTLEFWERFGGDIYRNAKEALSEYEQSKPSDV